MRLEPTGVCPHCGGRSTQSPRYPRALCGPCGARITDLAGRPVQAYNESHTGGFIVFHSDDGSRCESVTASGQVLIDGRPYLAGEARMGGIVVQPIAE